LFQLTLLRLPSLFVDSGSDPESTNNACVRVSARACDPGFQYIISATTEQRDEERNMENESEKGGGKSDYVSHGVALCYADIWSGVSTQLHYTKIQTTMRRISTHENKYHKLV
jgi:hypothetical protein